VDQLAPLHAGAQPRQRDHRRVGRGVLPYHQVAEIERKAERVEVQRADPDGIAAGIEGTFEGGYRAAIIGNLKTTPDFRIRGNIGTFDYGWDGISATGPATPFDWTAAYFDIVNDFTLEWWGWVYHGGSNSTWSNSITGNAGDITD